MSNKLPVGIQVYGLRDELENTPERFGEIMRQIKSMGYDGVELAGLYGLAPETIRDTLNEVGLTPISAHVPLVDMMEDIDQVLKDYGTIGCKYLVVPYLPEEYRHLTPGYEKVIAEITKIGEAVTAAGKTLLYHNHDFEFVKLEDGTYGLDDIYAKVPENCLKAEPDTCWINVAGLEPADYVKQYTGRCPIVHLKDFYKKGNPKNLYKLIGIDEEESGEETGVFRFREVGFGQQIWEPILDAAVEAKAEWVIVEQDEHYELSPLECARRSREYLKILGW